MVGIDGVGDQKYACMAALRSQFSDWNAWLAGYHDEVPKEEEARKAYIAERFQARDAAVANRWRDLLVSYYGEEQGSAIRFAEAFEVSEYGSQPTPEQLKALFPFFD